MAWKVYHGNAQGVVAKGDPRVPRTRWWNWPFLAWFTWKQVTVFQVMALDASKGYRVGYRPGKGKARYSTTILQTTRFKVKNGREDCAFFALDLEGKEVEIMIVRQSSVDSETFKDVPLI